MNQLTNLPKISIKPQKPERIRHPCGYDNEIASLPPADQFANGDIAEARDSQGKIQGLGFLNTNSRIAFRYLTRNPSTKIDEAFWRNRVHNAMNYRKSR